MLKKPSTSTLMIVLHIAITQRKKSYKGSTQSQQQEIDFVSLAVLCLSR